MSMTCSDQLNKQRASGQEEMMMPGLGFGKWAQISPWCPKGQKEEWRSRGKQVDKSSEAVRNALQPQNAPQRQVPDHTFG